MSIYSAAIALCGVEEDVLKLKAQLCDGSMLKGHTAKQRVNMLEVAHAFGCLKGRVELLEEAIRRIPHEELCVCGTRRAEHEGAYGGNDATGCKRFTWKGE
jgi:hypothetical protein